MKTPLRKTGFVAVAALAATLLAGNSSAQPSEDPGDAPQRISALIRQSVSSVTPLDRVVDGLMPHLAEYLLQDPDPLMEVLKEVDRYQTRFRDQAQSIRVLQAQAIDARDTLLFQCLGARLERADELCAAAEKAYQDLLTGITEEDLDLTRHALEIAALLPRLDRELNALKNECVGTLPGIYVERLPHRKG